MKNLLYLLTLTILLASCKKDRDTEIQPVNLNLQVKYALDSSEYSFPVQNVKVELVNLNSNVSETVNTNEEGAVTLNITPGTYDIKASVTISAAEYTKATGLSTEKDIVFNASKKNLVIGVGYDETVDLQLVAGRISEWVIKQVYFSGSDRIEGALYRDQFIEIYNNSDQILYADSLYIVQVLGHQKKVNVATYHLTQSFQYDWNKSMNMPQNIDANNDYIYAKALLMIPGTGKQYPVEPGKSIIIAQTAINHKSPFIGNDGESVSVRNPDLTIDLSGADFEAYYAPFSSRPLDSDIDNPSVPNVDVLHAFGLDMILDNPGRDAYAIFKVDATQDVKNWPQFNLPTVSAPSSTATKYYQIPTSYVLDAFEVQPNEPSAQVAKKLGAQLDAGYTYVPKGSYSSQSVIRKTERTEGGRVILKDTNNSAEDFDHFDKAQPRGFK